MEMRETEGLKAVIAKLKSERPDDQDSLKKMEFLLEAKEQNSDPHEVGKKFLELFPDELERF